ncbi:Ger(x)C family spore germination protein [Clostridium sp. 19966]|uniref:Ger(x)C family spore germination protein n=1 Tax=Clostridium sp. 19966 TaxID=2768166 RepID=UPI0028DE3A3B|nr:Ger(x)C family spore germination protein [Clostridium sp. 19966]MDT8717680.1 Ger(x)C family spore germination protein [Clostridium sp. 19966]
MIKKFIALILCGFILTGCFDRKELNKIGIVLAVAMDKDLLTNEIIISCEVLKPTALKSQSNPEESVEVVSAKGFTVYEAVRNISKKLDRKSYFAHNKLIIISEKLAKESITSILDVFIRDPEIRLSVWLVIAKDTEARTLLNINHGVNQIQAFYINEMIKTKWATSQMQVYNLLDFYKKLLKKGNNPTTGAITVINEFGTPELLMAGTAAFRKDKLAGYLDYKESRGLNWITNSVKGGIINIPGMKSKDKDIAIEIKRARGKILPKLQNGKITFLIKVNVIGNISEIRDTSDISEIKTIEKLESETKKVIDNEIKEAVNKAKNQFHSDIFGFGYALSRYYPKEWDKIKDQWDKLFFNINYKTDINVKIKRSGQLQKPFAPEK